jgi:long-chain fatty acid transport protein
MITQKRNLVLAAAVAIAVSSPAVFATNGILQAGNGMVAHGLGGAGLANAAEASSGMDNPALINHTGNAVNVAWSMFMPLREMDATALGATDSVSSDSNEFAIPQASFTVKASDLISWGVMAYALGGMNVNYPTGPFAGAGTGAPESTNLQGLIIAPQISFAISKDFSVGVAALIGKETLTVRSIFNDPTGGNGLTGDGTEMGYGYKLGVNWNVTPGISLAATMQPKMEFEEMGFFKDWLSAVMGYTGDAQVTLPDQYGIGAKFALGQSVDVVVDVMSYSWSKVELFEFFGWEDQLVYKLGVEFRPGDKWSLRAGYNYGESPIKGGNKTPPVPGFGGLQFDAAFANYVFPAISEEHITIGVGYKLAKNISIDGYYLYSPETTEKSSAFGPFPAGFEVSMSQSAFGLGMNVGF